MAKELCGTIVRTIVPVNFVLQTTARSKPFVVHADKLKKCHGSTPESWLPSSCESEEDQHQRPVEQTTIQTMEVEHDDHVIVDSATQLVKKHKVATPRVIPDDCPANATSGGVQAARHRKTPHHLQDYVCA